MDIDLTWPALALAAAGCAEAVLGGLAVVVPDRALPILLGRTLTVGATSSPVTLPLVAAAGASRFGLAAFMVTASVMVNGAALRTLAALGTALHCVLLQVTALHRSHPRSPLGWTMGLSLAYGVLLTGALGAETYLTHGVSGLAHADSPLLASLASLAIGCGLLLSMTLFGRQERTSSFTGGDGGFVLMDQHHKLSPGAKRLLS